MASDNRPASLLFALADHDPRICFSFDLSSNRFVYANPAFNSFFQIPVTAVTPELLLEMVHPDDLNYLKESYEALQPGIFKGNIEFRMQLPDKKEYTMRLGLFLSNGQNHESILSGFLEDISAYKDHNDKLNKFTNKKNSILNILSHDLAGPLGSIQNLSKLLSRETKEFKNKDVDKWLSLIEKSSKKGMQLIQEFIKQEFLESADAEVVKRRTDLAQALEFIVQEYKLSENEMSLTFHFNSPTAQVFADIDENKFLQVINNLLSNAIKFTPDGGTITLGLEEKEKTVLVTVKDTGVGIPKKFHANLFDKFNAARRPGLKGEPSVGLGMSIIKTIVDWHEGNIWFESEENKGTTFYIEIEKSS